MRTYQAFYGNRVLELQAESLYAASLAAIRTLNVPRSRQGLLAIVLADVPVDPASI